MKTPFSKFFQGKATSAATVNDPASEAAKESVTMSDPSTTDSTTEQPDVEASMADGEPEQSAQSQQGDGMPEVGVDDAMRVLEAERDEFKDQYLRAKAEAENIRRRADQQRGNDRKYANEAFARELLDVRESLDHAGSVELEADTTEASQQMREGLELTLKQMDAALEKFHIESIAPEAGDKFDAELHQAMSMQPVEGVAANHIVSTIRKGYRLHDRLLRPAMVIVSNAQGGTAENTADQPGEAAGTAADDAPAT